MKISTKGKYGLRAMVDLAVNSNEYCVSIKSIAERQNISENYLEQLIASLKKAELVESIRGAQGGYRLSRASGEISVGEILRALEGNLAPVNCVVGEVNECSSSAYCVTRVIWERIKDSINSVVDTTMLSDLVEDYIDKSKKYDINTMKGDCC